MLNRISNISEDPKSPLNKPKREENQYLPALFWCTWCKENIAKLPKPLHLTRSDNGVYEKKAHQATFSEDATLFGGFRLNSENRWDRMSRMIPWAVFEAHYAALFTNPQEGKPAKSARVAIVALIIKKRYGFSDYDTVGEIRENPYLQYFMGFAKHTIARPLTPADNLISSAHYDRDACRGE